MSVHEVVVIGGGEHARVLVDAIRSRPDAWNLRGFVDPRPCPNMHALGVRHLGGDDAALAAGFPPALFIVGVGTAPLATVRERIVERYQAAGVQWATVVHARATVSAGARLGPGVTVLAGAVINVEASIADHAIINSGAVIEHGVSIGAFTHVAPGAVIGGGTTVGSHSHLGLGCRVRDHVTIGDGVLVGMGAVVIASVSAGAAVMGIPARERTPGDGAA